MDGCLSCENCTLKMQRNCEDQFIIPLKDGDPPQLPFKIDRFDRLNLLLLVDAENLGLRINALTIHV